jgi:hypothetical protein
MTTLCFCAIIFLLFRFLEMRNEIRRLHRLLDPRAVELRIVASPQRKWFYFVAVFLTLTAWATKDAFGLWFFVALYIPIWFVLMAWANRIEDRELDLAESKRDTPSFVRPV